jgi:hypothetical protein
MAIRTSGDHGLAQVRSMTCKIISAGAIDWCETHDKPLTRELDDGTRVCKLYKKDPLAYVPPQFHRLFREGSQ